jgi:hypothetical protein
MNFIKFCSALARMGFKVRFLRLRNQRKTALHEMVDAMGIDAMLFKHHARQHFVPTKATNTAAAA